MIFTSLAWQWAGFRGSCGETKDPSKLTWVPVTYCLPRFQAVFSKHCCVLKILLRIYTEAFLGVVGYNYSLPRIRYLLTNREIIQDH